MTSTEQVTNFVLRRDEWKTSVGTFGYVGQAREALATAGLLSHEGAIEHIIHMTPIRDLLQAINAYLEASGIEPEDRGFGLNCSFGWPDHSDIQPLIPEKYCWLICFAVEGSNEGYYIHVGAIIHAESSKEKTEYLDFGHAKTYSPDSAYAIAKETQRFLTAAAWN